MAKKKAKKETLPAPRARSGAASTKLLKELRDLIESTRAGVAQAVNSAQVLLYWQVGHRLYTVSRGQQGSHFRGPRCASYRAAESGSITGMQTPACWQRSRAALCRGKLRSRAQRSSWFPWAPQSKQRKRPLVNSTEKQRGTGRSVT